MPHSPSFPQHCGGAARASPVCIAAMTVGRRISSIWHTHTHQTRCPRRCVHGALKRGDCERVRPCLAPRPSPIATERRPQFPGHASSDAEVVDMLLFVSQAERVRARGSHRRALRFGASRSRSNRTRTRAFGARRSAPSHASQAQSAHRRPACSAAHGGRGRGTLVGAAPSRPARVRSRLTRAPAT